MHPAVEPLAFLLGTWVGEGDGDYPTIEAFRYGEEITFSEVNKPFIVYTQRTWALDDRRPLHTETGYLRPSEGTDRVEYVLAQPTGIAEIGSGTHRPGWLKLSANVTRTPTAKTVEQVEREIEVRGDSLRYEFRMSMTEVPFQRHLVATLRRAERS